MKAHSIISRLLTMVAFLSFLGAVMIFVGSSSRMVQLVLGKFAAPLTTFAPILVFTLAMTGMVLFLWSKLFQTQSSPTSLTPVPPASPRKPINRLVLGLQIALSLVIFSRSLAQINVPFDWDEHEHVSQLAGGDAWHSINPFFGSENHSVAAIASFLSMKILGPTKFAARLPALLFAVAFLYVLNIFCINYASTTAGLLCFLTLAGNIMIIYMMHSMRGYIPMLLFTTTALLYLLDFVSGKPVTGKRLVAFTLVTGLGIFCHTFGGLFTALLFISTIIWIYRQRKMLPKEFIALGNRFLTIQAVWLSLFGLVSVFVLLHLRDTGFALPKAETPAWLKEMATYHLFTLFGFVRLWEIRLFAILLVGLMTFRIYRPEKRSLSFPTLFLLVTTLVITMVAFLLQLPLLEGRMLTPFFILFLFWVGETLDRIDGKKVKAGIFLATLSLFVLPFHLHHDADDGVPEHFADHERFATEVKRIITPFTDRCLSFSGDPAGAKYAANFYFVSEKHVALTEGCAHHFHLFYGEGLFDASYEWEPPANAVSVNRLYDDAKGRTLFQIQNGVQKLSQNGR